jgi:hypothetical protein
MADAALRAAEHFGCFGFGRASGFPSDFFSTR